jgi:crotonobetainyl-CoA:carnitine CoA-transferase CaiB-like acyl-CoA transferase
MEALAQTGAVCGAVLDTAEVLENPHLRARGMTQDVEHPVRGRYPMIGCPVRLSDSPVEIKPSCASRIFLRGDNEVLVIHRGMGSSLDFA